MKNLTWFNWHSWLGVMSGLMLFVICWSGTAATLSHEFDWLLNEDMRVTVERGSADYETIYETVQSEWPNAKITALHAPRYANAAAEVIVKTERGQLRRVYVNPYTGAIQGSTSMFNVQRFFRSFHMNLFEPLHLTGELGVGLFIVGILGIVLIGSLVTGLYFYKRWWTRFFELRRISGPRALWSSLHKLAGLWSAWFVLVIGVTGGWYLAEYSRLTLADGVVTFMDVGPEPSGYAATTVPVVPQAGEALPFAALMERARSSRPDIEIKTIRPAFNSGYFYIDGQAGHTLVRDRANKLYLEASSGTIVYDQAASELSAYWRWSDTADPLHFGSFGGIWTKLIWFCFGILLSGLALTGAWLHVKRIQLDTRGRARWGGTMLAISLTLMILSAASLNGVSEVKSYGAVIDGIQHWPSAPLGVWLFVAVWVSLTFVIIALWAWMLTKSILRQ